MAAFQILLGLELSIAPHRTTASEGQGIFRNCLRHPVVFIPTRAFLKQPDKQKLTRLGWVPKFRLRKSHSTPR